jgi:hypothetical protein
MEQVLTRRAERERSATADGAPARTARHALSSLLLGLRSALQTVAGDRLGAVRRRRGLLQRRFLLGLELLCKLEDQLLLPALTNAAHDAVDDGSSASANVGEYGPSLAMARREIELLRDLSALVGRTAAGNRDAVISVLQGLSDVHDQRVDALIHGVPVGRVPWAALEREMRGLLGRWRAEVLSDGDIEDEDRDPVGLPPR